jgi:DNA-binding sugar fermentation-stimulating protein
VNSEKKLVENIISHLKGKGYFVATEVPFLSRSIDIVYQTKKKEIVAIELKWITAKRL